MKGAYILVSMATPQALIKKSGQLNILVLISYRYVILNSVHSTSRGTRTVLTGTQK